jgi:DNA polymerase III subunit delta
MDFNQLIQDIKNKVYHPVYFLTGEEPYYIDEVSTYIQRHVLTDEEKEFNQTVVYGKDTDVSQLIGVVKRFPMMANHQVVIVKEAQDVKKIEELVSYMEHPLTSTILVLCYKYKKLDKRSKFYKAMAKTAVVFESAKLYDNKIPDWISSYLKQQGYTISQKAVLLLSDYLGNDLSKIVNELSKLIINIPKGEQLTELHVEQQVGISKEFNYYELQHALGSKDVFRANQIIVYFAANPKDNPLIVAVSNLYTFFYKVLMYHCLSDKSTNNVASKLQINPYFVSGYLQAAKYYPIPKVLAIFSLLRVYDLKSKGVDVATMSQGDLYKELVYKILHC